MSVYDMVVTLHLRGEVTGRDRFNTPIYGPPRDVPIAAWWEAAGSAEEINRAEQTTESYWVYSEDTRLQAVDALTIHKPSGDIRCEVAPPQSFPPGLLFDEHIRVLATKVAG